MRRFHNPMTLFMLIILAVAFVATTVCFIAIEMLREVFFVYWIIIGFYALIVLILVLSERKFRKDDEIYSQELGEDYNTAGRVGELIKQEPKKNMAAAVAAPLLVIGGFVALCMFNFLIGTTVFVLFLAAVLFVALKKYDSVEEYVAKHRNRKARPFLRKIHEQVLALSPDIVYAMSLDKPLMPSSPIYFYTKHHEEGAGTPVFAMRTIGLGPQRKNIYISVTNPDIYNVFADRLDGYKIWEDTGERLFPRKEPFDYGLIADMVRFNIEQIDKTQGDGYCFG